MHNRKIKSYLVVEYLQVGKCFTHELHCNKFKTVAGWYASESTDKDNNRLQDNRVWEKGHSAPTSTDIAQWPMMRENYWDMYP